MADLDGNVHDRLTETFAELARLAHTMNNPLTSLLGRAQLLQMRDGVDPKITHAANVIEESACRIASHVQELAALVRDAREMLAVESNGERDAEAEAEVEGLPVR